MTGMSCGLHQVRIDNIINKKEYEEKRKNILRLIEINLNANFLSISCQARLGPKKMPNEKMFSRAQNVTSFYENIQFTCLIVLYNRNSQCDFILYSYIHYFILWVGLKFFTGQEWPGLYHNIFFRTGSRLKLSFSGRA